MILVPQIPSSRCYTQLCKHEKQCRNHSPSTRFKSFLQADSDSSNLGRLGFYSSFSFWILKRPCRHQQRQPEASVSQHTAGERSNSWRSSYTLCYMYADFLVGCFSIVEFSAVQMRHQTIDKIGNVSYSLMNKYLHFIVWIVFLFCFSKKWTETVTSSVIEAQALFCDLRKDQLSVVITVKF